MSPFRQIVSLYRQKGISPGSIFAFMSLMDQNPRTIYTIGHSNRTLEAFITLLLPFKIETVVDVRQFPGSRKYPQFNKDALEISLPQNGIEYIHLIDLGGRRKPNPDSFNTAWKHPAFRSYADYMETDQFKTAILTLENIAERSITAYMCSEAVWWSCHRSMISDYLKVKGWKVEHIMVKGKATEHPYTSPARIVDAGLRRFNNF
jgi:uncharacterized protein (DUF488 family)